MRRCASTLSAFTVSVGTSIHNRCVAEPCFPRFTSGKLGPRLANSPTMAIEDLWYRNAIIYCLNVEKFMDANGDGVGDFEGLAARLPYLAGLGVTCVWLQPFHESPNCDNGYDVSDYYC